MPISIPIWSDQFLAADIQDQPEYQDIVDDPSGFDAFVDAARQALIQIQGIHDPDEDLTIERVIEPILDVLG
jgi:hypothetical protein